MSVQSSQRRIKAGWSLEKALTTPAMDPHDRHHGIEEECEDHLRNKYRSLMEMCAAYGISKTIYQSRINAGWTMEKALTTSAGSENVPIPRSTYQNRLNMGWDKERAKTQAVKTMNKSCMDHLGNKYNSISDMCRAHKISRTVFIQRIKRNWTLEDALTTPVRPRKKI